jgi:hypothetical protein
MITVSEYGTRKVYWTDTEKEWQDLVSNKQIVYTKLETELVAAHPEVLDESFRTFLFRIKMSDPSAMLLGVQRRSS